MTAGNDSSPIVVGPAAGGGWHALVYTLKLALRVGPWRLWQGMRSRNTCKTCALGMGGQKGGMVDELGHFPEVCKKSLQAMAADLQPAIDHSAMLPFPKLAQATPLELEAMGRLTQPLYHDETADRYAVLSWSQALQIVTDALRQTSPNRSFFYFSGRSSNEAGFLLSLLARHYGTNNINNCSYYCHQASGVGLSQAVGVGTATVRADDLDQADLFFLIGGNPASNHPRLMSHLMRLRRRGGKVVVINPVRERGLVRFRIPSDLRSLLFGTDIATHYLQPHIGGDIAVLTGIVKALIAAKAIDHAWLNAHATDGDSVLTQADSTPWHEIEMAGGLTRDVIEGVAAVYSRSQKTIFAWTMGITHHVHGVENVQWIVNAAAARGMIAKPGAGLLPIRGHSNVQGIGSVGVVPRLKPQMAENWRRRGLPLPPAVGLDTMGCMKAAAAGAIDVGLALGGNLLGSNPDLSYARNALSKVGLMVYLNTTMNTGHVHGRGRRTLILPVLARDEEPYRSTQESMFNFVRLSDGGKPRLQGPKSEVEIIQRLASGLQLDPGIWDKLQSSDQIRELIADVVPNLEPIRRIGITGEEFHIPGRTPQQALFPTADGRVKLFPHPLPKSKRDKDQFMLMTVRSEGQFNTVVYEEEDYYRGQERRDVVLMNPVDMERLGVKQNQPVRVSSEVGTLEPILPRPFEIKQGAVLMYYPEANALVPAYSDEQSKTPAFKAIPVGIEAIADQPVASEGRPRFSRWWRRRRPAMRTC